MAGDLTVAVNLSPIQFKSHNLVGAGCRRTERIRLAPEQFELEITEMVLLEDTARDARNPARAARARRPPLDRRFRHRLFVAELSAASSRSKDQARPVLRARTGAGRRELIAIVRAVASRGADLGRPPRPKASRRWISSIGSRRKGCKEGQGYLFSPGGARQRGAGSAVPIARDDRRVSSDTKPPRLCWSWLRADIACSRKRARTLCHVFLISPSSTGSMCLPRDIGGVQSWHTTSTKQQATRRHRSPGCASRSRR